MTVAPGLAPTPLCARMCVCARVLATESFSVFTSFSSSHFSSTDLVCLRSVSNCSASAPHRQSVTGAAIPLANLLLCRLHAAHTARSLVYSCLYMRVCAWLRLLEAI